MDRRLNSVLQLFVGSSLMLHYNNRRSTQVAHGENTYQRKTTGVYSVGKQTRNKLVQYAGPTTDLDIQALLADISYIRTYGVHSISPAC